MCHPSDTPSVSVIVPIYNVEKYITRCVRSLMEQTLNNIEYIFINDCTPDKSMEILQNTIAEYPQRQKYIHILTLNKNHGSAFARDSGIKVATGEYIIHCDSDDWVEKDMYEKMYQKAVSQNADIVICDYVAEYTKKQVHHSQYTTTDKEDFVCNLLSGKLHNSMWNKLIRSELYKQLDFTWKEGINMWEDVSVIPRLAYYAQRISYLPESLYHYSQTNTSAYTKKWSLSSLENVVSVVNIINAFFEEKGDSCYQQALLYFKLHAKYVLLHYAPPTKFKLYRTMFPETNHLIFSHPAFPFYSKIIMWCWLHSCKQIASIILFVIATIKNTTR